MTTFFEWDAKEGGQSLKVLPNVINWFERAEEAVLGDNRDSSDSEEEEKDERRKIIVSKAESFLQSFNLLRLYMPLLFEGVVNIRVYTDEKRKILDG